MGCHLNDPTRLRLQSRLCIAAAGLRIPESLKWRTHEDPRQRMFQRLFSDPCSADLDLNLKHAPNGHRNRVLQSPLRRNG